MFLFESLRREKEIILVVSYVQTHVRYIMNKLWSARDEMIVVE